MALVNKQELARILDCSLPTLTAWLARYDDFPIEQRGTNGRDYEFDATKVLAYMAERRAEEAAAQAERDAAIQQLIMPGLEPDASEALPTGLSIKDQKELLQIRRMQRQEAELNRELVPAAEVATLLSDAWASLNARLQSAIRSAGRELDLPPATIAAIETRLRETQREFVRETRAYLLNATDDAPATGLH